MTPHLKYLIFFSVIVCSLHVTTTSASLIDDLEDDIPSDEDVVIVDGKKYEPERRQFSRRQLGLYGGQDANEMLQEAFAQAGIDLASSNDGQSGQDQENSEQQFVPPKKPLLHSIADKVRNFKLPSLPHVSLPQLPSLPSLPPLPSLSASIQSAFARRRVTPLPSVLIPIMARPHHFHGGMPVMPPVLHPPPPTNIPGGVNTNGILQVKGPAFVTTPYFHPTNLAEISKIEQQQQQQAMRTSTSSDNNDGSRTGNSEHVVVITPPVLSSGMKSSASDSSHHYVIVKPTPQPISTQMTNRPTQTSSQIGVKPHFVKINLKDASSASWIPSSLSSYSGFKPIPTTSQQSRGSSSPSQVAVSVSHNGKNDSLSSPLTSSSSSSPTNYKNSIKYYENLFSNFQDKNNWFKPIEKYKSEHWKVSHSINDSHSPEESSNEVVRSIVTANSLYSPSSSSSSSSGSFSSIRFKKPTTTMTSFTINPSALLEQISKVNTNRNTLSCKNKDLGWCDYSDSYPE